MSKSKVKAEIVRDGITVIINGVPHRKGSTVLVDKNVYDKHKSFMRINVEPKKKEKEKKDESGS